MSATRCNSARKVRGSRNPIADRREVARTAATDHEPGQRARQVGRAFRRSRLSRRARDRRRSAPTASSRRAIAAGSVSGAASRCASSREPAAVTVRSIAASSEPRRSPDSVRISSRLARVAGSIRQRRLRRLARRRRQRRPLAELGALDIGDAGRRRGQFEPRHRAERFGGRHREIAGEPPLRGAPSNTSRVQRRHRRQRAQVRGKLGIAVERIGDDDLARLELRDRGRKRRRGRVRRCGIRRSRCRARPARSGCRRRTLPRARATASR